MLLETNEFKEVMFLTTKENLQKLIDKEMTVEEFVEVIDLVEIRKYTN